MSSHQTDIQALKAKIARLEAELEVEREHSEQAGSRVKQLEIEKRLSAPKLNDRAAQRELSTDASDPAQRAEISQLRDELATKDAELATKGATIGQLVETVSCLRNSLRGYRTLNDRTQEGMRSVKRCWEDMMDDCDTARNDIRHVFESTGKFELPLFTPEQDNAMSPLPEDTGSSGSRATNFAREGASGPPQPSPELTTVKAAADGASGPPRPASSAQTAAKLTANTDPASTTPSTQNYSQALKTRAQKQAPRRGRYNPRTFRPNVTHAEFSSKREAEQQAQPESRRQQQSQKPNKALGQGSQRGGEHQAKREDPRPVTGIGSANAEKNTEVKAPAQKFDDVVRIPEQKSLSPAAKGFDIIRVAKQKPSRPPLPEGFVNIFAGIYDDEPTAGMPVKHLEPRDSQGSSGTNVPSGLGRKSSSPPAQKASPPSGNIPGALLPWLSNALSKGLESRDSDKNKAAPEDHKGRSRR